MDKCEELRKKTLELQDMANILGASDITKRFISDLLVYIDQQANLCTLIKNASDDNLNQKIIDDIITNIVCRINKANAMVTRHEAEILRSNTAKMRFELQKKENDLNHYRSKYNSCKLAVDANRNSIEALENKLRYEIKKNETLVSNLKKSKDDIIMPQEKQIKEFVREYEILSMAYIEKEKDYDMLKNENNMLKNENNMLKNENNVLKRDYLRLKNELQKNANV